MQYDFIAVAKIWRDYFQRKISAGDREARLRPLRAALAQAREARK